jgi:hypothetical protein
MQVRIARKAWIDGHLLAPNAEPEIPATVKGFAKWWEPLDAEAEKRLAEVDPERAKKRKAAAKAGEPKAGKVDTDSDSKKGGTAA